MIYFLIKNPPTTDVQRLISSLGARTLNQRRCLFNGKKVTFSKNDLCVRWGSRIRVECRTINSVQGIVNCFNKRKARGILKELSPETWFKVDKAKIPFIARPSLHTHGNDFWVVRSEADRVSLKKKDLNGWYFTELLNIKEEYRVYVGGGKVLGAWRKEFKGGELRANRAITGLKWKFLMPPKDVGEIAVKGCERLGIELAGVDIAVTDRPLVLEVNGTPRISSDDVLRCYRNYILTWT